MPTLDSCVTGLFEPGVIGSSPGTPPTVITPGTILDPGTYDPETVTYSLDYSKFYDSMYLLFLLFGGGATSGGGGTVFTGGGTEVIISGDFDTFNYNNHTMPNGISAIPYWTYNSTWGAGSYVNGVDFTQSITQYSGSFPDVVRIDWNWGATPSGINVYGYPALFYGTYQTLEPITTITPRTLDSITTLRSSHNVSWGGTVAEFNVIYDFYLHSVPGPDNPGLFEIEIHLHTPYYFSAYIDGISSGDKYAFTDSLGTAWTIVNIPARTPPMVIFVQTGYPDVPVYDIDVKALFTAAKSHGIFAGTEYFVGMALGAEPRSLDGVLQINDWTITYS